MQYDYARPGYTVTPNIVLDEVTGEETVKVMQADVRSGEAKEFINQQNVREQANNENWYYDEDGNATYGLEASEDEIDILLEDMGGAEAYDEALFWAFNTLSDQDMSEFDEAMESGDLTLMADFMGQLNNLYQNRSHDVPAWDDAQNYVFTEVCSPEMYRDVQEFVVNNYNDGDINTFNALVNSNDKDDIDFAINTVIAAMNGEEYYEDDEDEYED